MIKQFVSQEFCLACQGCCRFAEIDSVWSPSLLNNETIAAGKRIRLIPNPGQDNFLCIFFNLKDNKCKIYSFRPFECQLYPFLINRNAAQTSLAVNLKCPFVEQRLKSKECKKYVRYLTDLLNSSGWKKTLKNNSQIFQAYPEVLNLAGLKL